MSDMSDELFRADVRTAWAAQGLGCLWAGALIPAVIVVLNIGLVVTGQSMTDSLETFVHYSIPVFALVGVLFGLGALRMGRKSRRQLVVARAGGGLVLLIGPDVREEGPFELSYGWDRVVGGKGMKMVWCDVGRGDELLVRLTHEIGSLRSPPEGWPREPVPMDRPAKHGGYALGDVGELVEVLRDA